MSCKISEITTSREWPKSRHIKGSIRLANHFFHNCRQQKLSKKLINEEKHFP